MELHWWTYHSANKERENEGGREVEFGSEYKWLVNGGKSMYIVFRGGYR